MNSSIASLSKTLGEKRKEYEETKELIRAQPVLAPHYDLDAIQQQIDRMAVDLDKLKAGRGEVKHSIATYEKYLELIKHTSVILEEMHNMKAMDLLLREFFSNFTIKATGTGKQRRYEIDYKLKEPYQGFLENGKFVHGRPSRTLLKTVVSPRPRADCPARRFFAPPTSHFAANASQPDPTLAT